MRVYFTVEGKVLGKARPRVVSRGGKVIAYTPKETVNYENYIKLTYQSQCKHYFKDKPLSMCISVYKMVPKSTSAKKKKLMVSDEIRPVTKPDLDNYYKLIADALNKVAYDDDSQIVECNISKYYSDKESVAITIEDIV